LSPIEKLASPQRKIYAPSDRSREEPRRLGNDSAPHLIFRRGVFVSMVRCGAAGRIEGNRTTIAELAGPEIP
jgi:hypothetical protein